MSFAVNAGEVHALIGPNGAGKSTLVHLISGLLPADGGSLTLDGVDLTHLAPHRRVAAGLSRCFQVTSIFPRQTVGENLLLAVQAHAGSRFRYVRRRDTDHELLAAAQALARRVTLESEWDRVAGTLPHGAQRKLDVALAIASAPKLLLLDEPMAGMGPVESAEMVALIQRLRQRFGRQPRPAKKNWRCVARSPRRGCCMTISIKRPRRLAGRCCSIRSGSSLCRGS